MKPQLDRDRAFTEWRSALDAKKWRAANDAGERWREACIAIYGLTCELGKPASACCADCLCNLSEEWIAYAKSDLCPRCS